MNPNLLRISIDSQSRAPFYVTNPFDCNSYTYREVHHVFNFYWMSINLLNIIWQLNINLIEVFINSSYSCENIQDPKNFNTKFHIILFAFFSFIDILKSKLYIQSYTNSFSLPLSCNSRKFSKMRFKGYILSSPSIIFPKPLFLYSPIFHVLIEWVYFPDFLEYVLF